MERLLVQVDPELKDLIPDFLARKRADAQAIRNALSTSDFATIARLAHRMKGEGGSFGFDGMTEIGAALESSAKQRDLDCARKLSLDLSAYLDNVELVAAPE